jgi:hypothetical protein
VDKEEDCRSLDPPACYGMILGLVNLGIKITLSFSLMLEKD